MPWKRVYRKVYLCDGCGGEYREPDYDTAYVFPLKTESLDVYDAKEDGWEDAPNDETGADDWLCPKCWHYCEEPDPGVSIRRGGDPGACSACQQALALVEEET